LEFPGVIGQKETQERLMGLVQHNRLSHALMLLGSEGSGALPLAIGFGQYVVSFPQQKKAAVMVADLFGGLSALPQEEAETPDAFPGFDKKALDLVHPDLHFSYPVIKAKDSDSPPVSSDYAKEWREFLQQNPYGSLYDWLQFIHAENKQGNITARECNEIIHKLSLKPYESRYRVLIMWMPEMLGNEGNKLLKLIEEPPPDTLFIFVAEKEEKILPTILSRCQLIRIPPLSIDDITDALVARRGLEADKARQIALVSDGNYREALQLIQHHEDNWNGLLREWLNATLQKSGKGSPVYAAQIKVVTQLTALGREKQKQLIQYFLQLIEQSLRLRMIGEDRLHLPPQEAEFAARLNKISGPGTQAALARLLENAAYYIERNANAKILFHSLCIQMRSIIQDKVVTGQLT
jgi:DNA polymerase-3 subunit delta'